MYKHDKTYNRYVTVAEPTAPMTLIPSESTYWHELREGKNAPSPLMSRTQMRPDSSSRLSASAVPLSKYSSPRYSEVLSKNGNERRKRRVFGLPVVIIGERHGLIPPQPHSMYRNVMRSKRNTVGIKGASRWSLQRRGKRRYYIRVQVYGYCTYMSYNTSGFLVHTTMIPRFGRQLESLVIVHAAFLDSKHSNHCPSTLTPRLKA